MQEIFQTMTTYKNHEYRLASYGGEFCRCLMGMHRQLSQASLGLIAISEISVAEHYYYLSGQSYRAGVSYFQSPISKTSRLKEQGAFGLSYSRG